MAADRVGEHDALEVAALAHQVLDGVAGFGCFDDFLTVSPWAKALRDGRAERLDPCEAALALPYYYA